MAKAAEHQQQVSDELKKIQKQIDEIQKQTQNKNAAKASSATDSAKGKQGKASQSSGGGKSQKSQQEAEESEEDMEQAKEDLEKAKEDMQQDQKDEDLLEAERAIAQMILVQKSLWAKTVAMNAQKTDNEKGGKTPVDRTMRADLLKLAKDQGTLSQTALVVASKMEETYVFGTVMEDIASDMNTASGELKPESLGNYVVEVQEDILNKLRQLDEALKKEQQKPKKKQGGGGGGGGGGGKQPVVPPLAEIKLLKIMENDLRAKTQKLHNELSTKDPKSLSTDEVKRIQRLAREQGRIKTKTTDLIEKAKEEN
ncbi:MAG TPA: hypothetical protein VL860_09445 [Planctomycetota bacterium]|nr:hypothetical protein [Planctomycetota bacterium]